MEYQLISVRECGVVGNTSHNMNFCLFCTFKIQFHKLPIDGSIPSKLQMQSETQDKAVIDHLFECVCLL